MRLERYRDFEIRESRPEDLHQRLHPPLEALRIFRERPSRPGQRLLQPAGLDLGGRHARARESLIDRGPIRVALLYDPVGGPASLGAVHDHQLGVLLGVLVGDLLERREFLGRVRHAGGEENDLPIDVIHRTGRIPGPDLGRQREPRRFMRRGPVVGARGVQPPVIF